MTDSLLRRSQHVLTPLQRRDIPAALELCAVDPVAHVVPAQQLERARDSGVVASGLWALRRRSGLSREFAGVLWAGANLTVVLGPHDADDEDQLRAEIASGAIARVTRPAAVVGEASLHLDLWGRLEPWWGPARQIRERQVSMSISGKPGAMRGGDSHDFKPRDGDSGSNDAVDLDLAAVRLATLDDFEPLLPACVHMFMGEVGYDPLQHGRAAYEERLKQLIRAGRSYVQYGQAEGRRQVVFKAEVGALGGGVAQLQGVWVHPEHRGRGLARVGLAEVVSQVQATTAPVVSLYVNDFNVSAVAAYRAVGFAEVGTFATVML